MENKVLNKEELVKGNEMKMPKYNVKSLDPKTLIKKDESIEKLYAKRFEDLTEEELKKLTLCKAKVEHLVSERYDRFGHKTVYERDVLSIKLCMNLVLTRNLSELEMNIVKALAPELIGAKAECVIPVKLITFMNKNGQQGYRYNAYVCPGVYMKAFLKSQELTQMCISNLTSSKKVNFYEISERELNVVENNDFEEDDF